MEAPKEIYIEVFEDGENAYPVYYKTPNYGNFKYIRSDLAELTWEDMQKITFILGQVCGLDKESNSAQSVYEEVLRRFNEQRGK